MKSEKRDEVFTAIDDLTAKLCAAIEAGNKAAKALLTIWLEPLETKLSNPNSALQSTRDDCLMTADEVASYVRIQNQTIYTWVSHNKIPHLRVNSELRFRRSAIDAWMESNNSQVETAREKSRQPVIKSGRSLPAANR